MRPLSTLRPADRDRLDVLCTQYRPAAAAAGMAAVMRDGSEANQVLAGRPDRRDPIICAQASFQRGFCLPARRAAMFRCRFEAYLCLFERRPRLGFINDEYGELRCAADDD